MEAGRNKQVLESLPKSSIQHLYREWVAPARREDKADMVGYLFTAFAQGPKSDLFWAHVDRELDYVKRCKEAKDAGLPKPIC